jgi:hypothetical protein
MPAVAPTTTAFFPATFTAALAAFTSEKTTRNVSNFELLKLLKKTSKNLMIRTCLIVDNNSNRVQVQQLEKYIF